ncbi:energy transducer TonB [Geobacter sp. DSM 9736]|uniref:energy transducer TonB n=1 Tax=Geobacter sp. DSM 9736 TaxID=1277350 RepID=UPI000B6144CE|nr:energy transducer TonB [Geobacter sp. DSM 9736]SNB45140.1 TonB family C-terminal domain-containing protein [Geobacter sp. DSM 9736]
MSNSINSKDLNDYREIKTRSRSKHSGKGLSTLRGGKFLALFLVLQILAITLLLMWDREKQKGQEQPIKQMKITQHRALPPPPTPQQINNEERHSEIGQQRENKVVITEMRDSLAAVSSSPAAPRPERISRGSEEGGEKLWRVKRDTATFRSIQAQPRAERSPLLDLRNSYAASVRHLVERRKEYPLVALKSGIEGRSLVVCVLRRNGSVKHVELVKSSGYTVLDNAALRAVRYAGTFPAVPDSIPGEEISVDIPLTFRVKDL